jgi:acyl-lipid omega-6 desaturase (Delta-12 desaturase)
MQSSEELTPERINGILRRYAQSSNLAPISIIIADLVLYILTLLGALFSTSIWGQIFCASLNGLTIGVIFVVGHDACHGSLFKSRVLNQILGRIAFLPSLHSFSLWNLWHNQTHHRFTNYKQKDCVFIPLSKSEFDQLNWKDRILHRIYRSSIGHGLYYLLELWWKKMIYPTKAYVPVKEPIQVWDAVWTVLYGVAFLGVMCWIPSLAVKVGFPSIPIWEAVFFGFALPFLVWNWIMGFLIYQHHTHPTVAWFSDYQEWDYLHAQVEGSTHVKFPHYFNFFFHNIMEHSAHHAQTRIPLYRLREAQRELEKQFSKRVIVIHWTWKEYFNTLKRCKLYDYETHHWLDFRGTRTSPCTLGQFASARKRQIAAGSNGDLGAELAGEENLSHQSV